VAGRGRPRRRSIPDILSIAAEDMLADAKWRNISWRTGTKGKLKARFAAVRVRTADGAAQRIQGQGSATSAGRRGLAYRRTPCVRGEEILSRQPARRDEPAHARCHPKGTMGLRAGPPADERRTRPRPFRGPILARPSPTRAHDNDRVRLPSASSPHPSEAGKKESTVHRPNQACRPYVTPSSISSPDHCSDARTAEDRSTACGIKAICQSSASRKLYGYPTNHRMTTRPGVRTPKAHNTADATFAIWNFSHGMRYMPATMGTTARSGPKKRPTNTAKIPHLSNNWTPRA